MPRLIVAPQILASSPFGSGLFSTRRYHDQPCQLTQLRVREIDRTVLGNDSIPSALVRRYLCNQVELAGSVNSGDRKPRILGSAYIQQVSGRRVVEIIHAVAGIEG